MKLVIISPYPPKKGGLSEYTKRNANVLRTMKDMEVVVIPFNSISDIFKVAMLYRIRPDVVRLEFNIPAYGLASIFLPFIIGAYRIFSKIVFVVNYHEVKRETDLLGPIGRWYYTIFSLLFHQIFVHTSEAKNILTAQCGANSDKVHVVPHGLYHAKPSHISGKEFNQKYHLNDKKMILFFGFIHPDKGIEYLIEAIKLLKNKEPTLAEQIQVVIAGGVRKRTGIFKFFEGADQRYDKLITQLIKENKLTHIITRINYVDENDVDALLKKAYIFVLPYTNTEQSGVLNLLIPYEKPIIASSIGGLKETLVNAEFLVPSRNPNAIYNLINMFFTKPNYVAHVVNNITRISKELEVKRLLNIFLGEVQKIHFET